MITYLKLALQWLFKLLFKIRVEGTENYKKAGDRVLIIANHTSLLDGILLYLFLPEKPTFAINTEISKTWYFQPILKFVDLFPLDPLSPLSLKSLIKFLKEDNKAVIFPEGRITTTGTIMKIYEGTGMVAAKSGATVLPIGIEGAQFSRFSYMKGQLRLRWFPQIKIIIHPPVDFADHQQNHDHRAGASQKLTDIMLNLAYKNIDTERTLFQAVIDSMKLHGSGRIIAEDIQYQPVTYRKLLMRSFILGKTISKETKPGESVGVLLPNTLANLVTILGLQCYGRVPAMLNFTIGPEGLVTACETALIKVVYTSRTFIEKGELEDSVAALNKVVKVIYLEDLREKISSGQKIAGLLKSYIPQITYSLGPKSPKQSPDDRAVVLFTSGSEGIPKGVVLSHRNLLTNYAQVHTYVGLTHNDLLLNFLPMFHSFGFSAGTVLPILDGVKVFFYPTPLHYRVIPELCYELGVTVMFGTNTFLAGYARHAHPADLLSLRYVVAGAEKLQDETRKVWNDKFGIRILEGYGATEASPVISVNTPLYNKADTVGRFLPGMEYYLEPVEGLEDGGRLFVSGDNIMSGYLFHGNEGEIIPPQSDRGIGWYDTGDIVSVDEQGYISIQGRAKRFAKIGGEMVSLTRVENLANSTWPDFIHAAAVVPDKKKGEQIYLITEHPEPDRKQLVTKARQEGISELSVPRKVIHVKAVPILGTGKVDYASVTKLANDSE